MLTAVFGVWTLMEMVFLLAVVLPLAWATNLDRSGSNNRKWEILILAFAGYWAYYAVTAPPGDWIPPVFSKDFWTSTDTWWFIGKYLMYGVAFAVLEMVSGILHEKRDIKQHWQAQLNGFESLTEYVNSKEREASKDDMQVMKNFCRHWNDRHKMVHLSMHELERTPQPVLNTELIRGSIATWIVLWPGYLASLIFGRFLDSLTATFRKVFFRLGGVVLKVIFRNAFKPN
jgi:hypothetical protein